MRDSKIASTAYAPDPVESISPDSVEPSLGAVIRALIADSKTLVEAEVIYQRARASFVWQRSRVILLALALAAAFGFFALVALVVGLLLALAPLLTAWGAVAAVTTGLLILMAGCAFVALSRFQSVRRALDDQDKP